MAKTTETKKPDVAWVNRDLTKQEKERMKKAYPDAQTVFDALDALVNTGHKFSVGWDGYANCYAASAFPTPNNSLNRGMALTARSTTIMGTLRGLVFRHFNIYEGNWRVENVRTRLDDDE